MRESLHSVTEMDQTLWCVGSRHLELRLPCRAAGSSDCRGTKGAGSPAPSWVSDPRMVYTYFTNCCVNAQTAKWRPRAHLKRNQGNAYWYFSNCLIQTHFLINLDYGGLWLLWWLWSISENKITVYAFRSNYKCQSPISSSATLRHAVGWQWLRQKSGLSIEQRVGGSIPAQVSLGKTPHPCCLQHGSTGVNVCECPGDG